jgi:uncharacterized integral membrane protein (TIGR00697 family)
MDTIFISPFIHFLQTLPAEVVSLILLLVCLSCILFLLKYFSAQGLYIYSVVAVLASNIQVLQGVQFSFSSEPVAMGTILFSTTYLCSDILSEHFGQATAKNCVWYCFIAQLLMTLFMMVAVGHPPIVLEDAAMQGNGIEQMTVAEKAIAFLFTPSPRILFASLLAFAISQFSDIAIFQAFKKLTKQKYLWFRTLGSTIISALIDTVLFTYFAFVLLAPTPVGIKTLIFTYILGSMVARSIVALISMPVMYTSYRFLPKRSLYATTHP